MGGLSAPAGALAESAELVLQALGLGSLGAGDDLGRPPAAGPEPGEDPDRHEPDRDGDSGHEPGHQVEAGLRRGGEDVRPELDLEVVDDPRLAPPLVDALADVDA